MKDEIGKLAAREALAGSGIKALALLPGRSELADFLVGSTFGGVTAFVFKAS